MHGAGVHLAHEGGIGTEQELLARLTLGIEGTAHLCATEGAVGEHTTVFAGEGYALCHALVNDIGAHLGQTIYVGFAGTIVATLHSVVEEAIYGVAVVLVVLGCVDTTLSSDGVCAAGGILDAEVLHLETHFAERGSGTGTCQTGTNDDNVEFALVLGVNEFLMCFIVAPLFRYRSSGNLRI